jgi:hypothetical protein
MGADAFLFFAFNYLHSTPLWFILIGIFFLREFFFPDGMQKICWASSFALIGPKIIPGVASVTICTGEYLHSLIFLVYS